MPFGHAPAPPHTHTLNFSLSLYDNISVFADSNFWLRSQGGKKTPSRWCKSERSVSTYKAVLARLRKRKSYPPKCHHHPPGKPSMCDGFPPRGVNGGRGGKKTKERHHYGCDCDLAWTEVGQTLHYQQFTFSSFKQPSSIAHTSTLSLSFPPSIRLNLHAFMSARRPPGVTDGAITEGKQLFQNSNA